MSGRRTVPETFGEFFERRSRELKQSPEWDQISKMRMTAFIEMMENEYYDCAYEPVPHRDRVDEPATLH